MCDPILIEQLVPNTAYAFAFAVVSKVGPGARHTLAHTAHGLRVLWSAHTARVLVPVLSVAGQVHVC